MNATFVGPIVSLIAGGALAAASVMGFISSQTSAPSKSPANAEAPAFDYGTTSDS